MANYTTSTSDKSKGKAIRLLLSGGIGLHLFYVGKIKAGIIRLILGLILWIGFIIGGIAISEWGMVLMGAILLIIVNVFDLIKLLLGTFKDNVGNNLRA